MVYENKEEALLDNDGAMTALEIVEALRNSHGYDLHPTNLGQDAVTLKSEFVEYKPLNQQGKPGKLYLKSSIPEIINSLIKKAKRRESFDRPRPQPLKC